MWLDKLGFDNTEVTALNILDLDNFVGGSSYLSHRIIDSFPRVLKWKVIRLKLILLEARGQRQWLTKLVLIL